MTAPYKTLGRLEFLDSLRGLAALYVILFHTLLLSTSPLKLSFGVRQFVQFGGTGVFLFFVISGFSLAMTMQRHIATGRPILSYSISRIFRIVPLFYLVLVYMTLWLFFIRHQFYPKIIFINISFLFNIFPRQQEGIVPASWTIGVEMLFYAVFPLIHAARPWVQVALFSALIVLFALMRQMLPDSYTYWTVIGWMPLFIIGMWSFTLLKHLTVVSQDKRRLGKALIAAGLAMLLLCALPEDSSHIIMTRLPIGVAYGLLIVGLGLQTPGSFSIRPLLFFGKISYSTYLLHALTIMALDTYLVRWLDGDQADVAFLGRTLVILSIVVPIAWIASKLIEQPLDRAGRTLMKRFTTRQ